MLLGFDPSLRFQMGWAELQGSEVNPALWDLATQLSGIWQPSETSQGFLCKRRKGRGETPAKGASPLTGFRACGPPILLPEHPQP